MGPSAVTLALLVFVFATNVISADAAILPFTDRTAFLAATGATDATGPLPDSGVATTNPQTVGTVTFSTPNGPGTLFIGTAGTGLTDWTTLNPGNDIAISGPENLNTLFAAPVFSAGFDFVEPSTPGFSTTDTCGLAACTNSEFIVTLLNGATPVDSFQFNAPDDTLAFVGVWSSLVFDRLEIREILTVLSDDNEYFGRVYTGTTALPVGPPAVPEPATIVLVGVGFIGAAVISVKRRRHA